MELAKGVRDFPPEIQLIREDLFRKIRRAFERHGFVPFASPAIERLETLTFKFQGDEDVQKEIFRFSDQGGRDLGLRFDLTVPLARFVSANKDLKLPFKRYEIGRVYRDGPVKLGRYREFWQCDADIVGASGMLADAECIRVLTDILSQLPFPYEVRVNNRKILECVFSHLGIEDVHKTMIVLDKLDKQGEQKVREELSGFLSAEQVERLFELLLTEGTDNGRLKVIEEAAGSCAGVSEMRELLGYVQGIAHVVFDPLLARGLSYYTGTVFEAVLPETPEVGSVGAGGRYDDIIGQMQDAKERIPAVGVSIGVDRLTDALLSEKQRFDRTASDVFVIPIKTPREAMGLADKLRARGFNVDFDVMGRSISKNLDYADKLGIPFCVVLGQKDLDDGVFTLKNMKTGEEARIPLADVDSFELENYA